MNIRPTATILVLCFAVAAFAAAEEVKPGVLRTPDERFEGLPGYDFEPHYAEINGYRMHYLDEGPPDGQVILMLHGEPTWSYLYRKMIPGLVDAGHRCVVPDLVGFGRSDKPTEMDVHTYKFHVDNIAALVEHLDLQTATFFGQDWGGLIGLRVVAENQERFARVVASNTFLSTGGDGPISQAFMNWKRMNQILINRGDIPTGGILVRMTGDESLLRPYDAPFPDPSYKAGPLIMPQRVPVSPDDPARQANEAAWAVFREWEKPFLTCFGDSDHTTGPGAETFREQVPGAKDQPHKTVQGAGHFIQETHPDDLVQIISAFIADNPVE